MTGPGREGGLAAEIVLGLLTGDEERAAHARLRSDEALRDEVAWWEGALSPLSAELAPIDPPARVKQAVMADIAARSPSPAFGALPPARKSPRAWQAMAAVLGVVALGELALLLTRPEPEAIVRRVPAEAEASTPYVAALVPSEATPPVIVGLDLPQGVLTVDPSGLEAGDRAVQLWLLPPGGGAPVSLGLLAPNTDNTVEVPVALAGFDPALLPALAISLEPEGGSPTGAPTGPVVASGQVRPLAPGPTAGPQPEPASEP